MKMTMVLLVSSVALLVGAANIHIPDIRNKIIDLISEIEKNPKDLFVENVKEHDSHCGNVFFCKVQNVLKSHSNTGLKDLLEQVKHYNHAKHVNCTEELKDKQSNGTEVQLKDMMTDLRDCMKYKNTYGEKVKTGQH